MQPPPYGSVPMYGGLRPLGVGEILDNTIQVYRKNFRALVTMVAVVVLPVEVVAVLINLSSRPSGHTTTTTSVGGFRLSSTSTDAHDAAVRLTASIVVLLLSLFAGRFAVGTCTRGVSDAYLGGGKADARASLGVFFHSFRSLLWVELLAIPALAFASLFCFIPGIWLWVSWLVTSPVLLVEGARGTHAMRRSFALVKSRWWPSLGLAIVATLLTEVVKFSSVVVLIAVILRTHSTASTAYIVAAGVIGGITSVVTTPLVAAAYVILYYDLRVRSEGLDLQLVLANLDSPVVASALPLSPPPPPPPPPMPPGSFGPPS